MAGKSLQVKVTITGVRESLRALSKMSPEANKAIRESALKLSTRLANNARMRAASLGSQAAILARTVKAVKDRVPAVQAGGSTRIGSRKKPAYKLLFGSEFGATKLRQFKARNTHGYWFYPSVDDMREEIQTEWNAAADRIIESFDKG